MNEIQNEIKMMYNGNKKKIVKNIKSENKIILVNAIIAGTQYQIKDSEFIEGLKTLTIKDDSVLHIPISSIAIASLDILDEVKYYGDDDYIIKLIREQLNIKAS